MAIRLKRRLESSWIELGSNAALFCEPATTMLVYAARAQAQALFVELSEAGEAVTKAGGRIAGVPDLADPARAKSCQEALFVVSLAELAATDWRGIHDEDGVELTYDAALLPLLLTDHAVVDNFLGRYLRPISQVVTEGKD